MDDVRLYNLKNDGAKSLRRQEDIDSTYSGYPGECFVETTRRGRNREFRADWTPFRNDQTILCTPNSTSGALYWFNPTRATYTRASNEDLTYQWTSRGNRTGRHTLVVNYAAVKDGRIVVPGKWKTTLKGLKRMLTTFPISNISYLSAITFTISSTLFVISAFLNIINYIPGTAFPGSTALATNYLAFFGSLIMVLGNIAMLLESFNDNRLGCTGGNWAIDPDTKTLVQWNHDSCHHNRYGKYWIWFPTWKDIKTHYIHDLAFLAAAIQLLAGDIFFLSGMASLPIISPLFKQNIPLLLGIYWMPKLLGALGIFVSSILTTAETQETWWKPAFGSLGWYVGISKVIGAVGIILTASFGLNQDKWAQYQSAVATLWGVWAFLISSLLRWYECLDQYPVEIGKEVVLDQSPVEVERVGKEV